MASEPFRWVVNSMRVFMNYQRTHSIRLIDSNEHDVFQLASLKKKKNPPSSSSRPVFQPNFQYSDIDNLIRYKSDVKNVYILFRNSVAPKTGKGKRRYCSVQYNMYTVLLNYNRRLYFTFIRTDNWKIEVTSESCAIVTYIPRAVLELIYSVLFSSSSSIIEYNAFITRRHCTYM